MRPVILASCLAAVSVLGGCAKQPDTEMKAAIAVQPPAAAAPADAATAQPSNQPAKPADDSLLPSDPMANQPPMPMALLKQLQAKQRVQALAAAKLKEAWPVSVKTETVASTDKPRLPPGGVAFRGTVDDMPGLGKPAAFIASAAPTWAPVDVLVTDDQLPPDAIAIVQETDPYLLDAGDRIRIFVYGQPNLSRTYPIDVSGTISMPLIGAVKARGLTVGKLRARIAGLLGAKFVRDPQVAVEVSQYRPFFILGEVRNAGQFAWVSGLTVQSAVAIAGGFSPRATQRLVRLTRLIEGVQSEIHVPLSYLVKPGDTIYVEERFF